MLVLGMNYVLRTMVVSATFLLFPFTACSPVTVTVSRVHALASGSFATVLIVPSHRSALRTRLHYHACVNALFHSLLPSCRIRLCRRPCPLAPAVLSLRMRIRRFACVNVHVRLLLPSCRSGRASASTLASTSVSARSYRPVAQALRTRLRRFACVDAHVRSLLPYCRPAAQDVLPLPRLRRHPRPLATAILSLRMRRPPLRLRRRPCPLAPAVLPLGKRFRFRACVDVHVRSLLPSRRSGRASVALLESTSTSAHSYRHSPAVLLLRTRFHLFASTPMSARPCCRVARTALPCPLLCLH